MTADEARQITNEFNSESSVRLRELCRRQKLEREVEDIMLKIAEAARAGKSSWRPEDTSNWLSDEICAELEARGFRINKTCHSDGPSPSFYFTHVTWAKAE